MTVVNQQYRNLNPAGGSPREISEVVNNLMNGKSNNTGTITLATGGATTTTIYNERIGYSSVIILTPSSAASTNIALPYGAWQDSTDQTVASVTTAYPIIFDTIDYENGISLLSSSHLKVAYSGLYNIQFSLQISNMDNATQDVCVWFRINGTDIPKSNSIFGLAPRKNATDPYHVIAAMNFFTALEKDDYVEIMWSSTDTLTYLDAKAAQTSPTRPTTPSVIATMNYISSDGYTTDIFVSPYVSSTSKGQATITHPANTTSDLTYRYIVVG
jgi:hypothetical protein